MSDITRRNFVALSTAAALTTFATATPALATNAAQFLTDYLAMANQMYAVINQSIALRDRVAADPTLFAQALAAPNNRPDLTAQMLTDANNAMGEVIFAWSSGNPTQKSLIMKLL